VEPSQNPEDEAVPAAIDVPDSREVDELEVARELVRLARETGVALAGPGGLLKAMTKAVIESVLDEELSEHLGYDRHDPTGYGSDNSRNGTRAKTVLTDACGQIEIEVPRDRAGTFEPQIVAKRQRRLTDVDEVVLSLYALGLTSGEISAHFADIYGATVSKDTMGVPLPAQCWRRCGADHRSWAATSLDGLGDTQQLPHCHQRQRAVESDVFRQHDMG
jgi:hypothetical protein